MVDDLFPCSCARATVFQFTFAPPPCETIHPPNTRLRSLELAFQDICSNATNSINPSSKNIFACALSFFAFCFLAFASIIISLCFLRSGFAFFLSCHATKNNMNSTDAFYQPPEGDTGGYVFAAVITLLLTAQPVVAVGPTASLSGSILGYFGLPGVTVGVILVLAFVVVCLWSHRCCQKRKNEGEPRKECVLLSLALLFRRKLPHKERLRRKRKREKRKGKEREEKEQG